MNVNQLVCKTVSEYEKCINVIKEKKVIISFEKNKNSFPVLNNNNVNQPVKTYELLINYLTLFCIHVIGICILLN